MSGEFSNPLWKQARIAPRRLGAAFTLALLTFAPLAFSQETNRTGSQCLQCHGDPSIAEKSQAELAAMVVPSYDPDYEPRTPDLLPNLYIPADAFHNSAHGELDCVACHLDAEELPHTAWLEWIECGMCHIEVEFAIEEGPHQFREDRDQSAPSCLSCHGEPHAVESLSPPIAPGVAQHVVERCATCHGKLAETYRNSFHGKATRLGSGETAVCIDCHGGHNIFPPSDERSYVSEANLTKTCGKCHENANANFTKFVVHADYRDPETHPAIFYTYLGMNVLLIGVLSLFLLHTLLWFQRSIPGFFTRLRQSKRPENERMIRRFRPVHVITHALIVVSFIGLVATGFPLKYSETSWARTLAETLGGLSTIRHIHRGLAGITFLYAAIHLGFLFVHFFRPNRPPLRQRLFGPNSMLPTKRDVVDLCRMMRWFLWLGPRPKFDRWTYWEKLDYWGEVWGLILIGGSGIMLGAPMLFTRWMPGWALNCAFVVHSIEALLAAGVIFLVHFFNTHLRPERFPVDTAMLTGRVRESEMREERPHEYDRLVENGELQQKILRPAPLALRILGTVLGITAFLTGLTLIVMALATEIGALFR